MIQPRTSLCKTLASVHDTAKDKPWMFMGRDHVTFIEYQLP